MKTQRELAERFRALHEQPGGFIMPNAWDAVSALLMKQAGFQALGSSSAAIAFALGRVDGEHAVTREDAVDSAALLGRVTGLPINGDLEDGFGPSPEDCVATVKAAIAGGLAGVGIEDTTADPDNPIHEFDRAVERVKRAALAAKGRIVLTGRTDNYLQGRPDFDDTLRRLVAFAEVGADVLYAPFLPDMSSISAVVKAVAPKPVNVLIGPTSGPVPFKELQAIGVRRVSIGAQFYCHAMQGVKDTAEALAAGDIATVTHGMRAGVVTKLLRDALAEQSR
jgi:2-methylisocitrate lyase-like PEP mutase family enzyme